MLYRLENVRKSFGTKDVLKDATWQHDPGRVVGLVGRNGAGKSTVLKIVSGDLEPDGGRRFLNAVADRIVEVAHGRLEEYPGDYDTYRKLKAERDRLRTKAAEQQRKPSGIIMCPPMAPTRPGTSLLVPGW